MTRIISDEVTIIAPLSAELESEKEETQSAHLIVLSGTNVGQVFELNKPEITIGRDDNVAVQIMDVGISRRHATILRDKLGAYFLHDAGSRNGTFANGHRVEGKHHLQDGDKIQIGVLTILKFTYSDAPEVEYAHVMYEAALRDGLTGIFNRRYFEERIKAEFAYALRHNSALALLILDLDLFKHINDSYGHPVGD